MDRTTLAAYDKDAAAFAKDWHEQPAPTDLHDVVTNFFIRGGISCDIGCGSGREVAWLNANGFPAEGFDASDGLLAEARRRYPGLKFTHAELPDLKGIAPGSFDNVAGPLNNLFDFGRKDQEARSLDDIFLPVDDRKEAVAVPSGDVASVEPSAAKRAGCFFGVIEVTFHHLRPAKTDFALLAEWDRLIPGLQVDNFQNCMWRGQSNAALSRRPVKQLKRPQRRYLSKAVSLFRSMTAECFEPLQDFHRQWRAA